jgi:hypothetical protein
MFYKLKSNMKLLQKLFYLKAAIEIGTVINKILYNFMFLAMGI